VGVGSGVGVEVGLGVADGVLEELGILEGGADADGAGGALVQAARTRRVARATVRRGVSMSG